jgi:phospholipid/cholesterol/gamma-HCH transport system substrate-binding protein
MLSSLISGVFLIVQLRTETKVGLFVLVALSIFGYSIYQLGVLPFGKRFNYYTASFDDISGLAPKAEVRIAGVKIGVVERISLLPTYKAEAVLAVSDKYPLHADARISIKQDGLVGSKFIELMPGFSHDILPTGSLIKVGTEPELIQRLSGKADTVAEDVTHLTGQLRELAAGISVDDIKRVSKSMAIATEQLAQLTGLLTNSMKANHDVVHALLRDIKELLDEIGPKARGSLAELSERAKDSLGLLEEILEHAHEGIKATSALTNRLERGEGTVGRLLVDEKPYNDIKHVASVARSCVDTLSSLVFIFDSHIESMQRPVDAYPYPDAKGYFDARLFYGDQYFYGLQLVASQKGWPKRWFEQYAFDSKGRPIVPQSLVLENGEIQIADQVDSILVPRNSWRFGLQAGALFGPAAVRAGLFDGTAGLGVDFVMPLLTDHCRWITSLELFDFNGQNRFEPDRRPHLKVLNRVYFNPNVYVAFGADDIISKKSASAFFGLGARFSSHDLGWNN